MNNDLRCNNKMQSSKKLVRYHWGRDQQMQCSRDQRHLFEEGYLDRRQFVRLIHIKLSQTKTHRYSRRKISH